MSGGREGVWVCEWVGVSVSVREGKWGTERAGLAWLGRGASGSSCEGCGQVVGWSTVFGLGQRRRRDGVCTYYPKNQTRAGTAIEKQSKRQQ